jgi:hypothetical protein
MPEKHSNKEYSQALEHAEQAKGEAADIDRFIQTRSIEIFNRAINT